MISDFALKYIKYKINTFIQFNLEDKLSFTLLVQKINDKELIQNTKEMLKLIIYNKNSIETKKFLSCYMIIQHSKVLISENSDIEQKVLKLSQKLINIIIKLHQSNDVNNFIVYGKKMIN